MVNVPMAVALVVVFPLAILLVLIVMVVNAVRRRPVHWLASLAVILVSVGGTAYGVTCLVMHVAQYAEETIPAISDTARSAVTSAADTGAFVVKEGVRAGSTAVVEGATEAADQIKGKWSEADLATARDLRIKFVRVLSSGTAADGRMQDVTVIVHVENTTGRKIDFAHLVSAGLVLALDGEGAAYPATGLVTRNGDLPPRMRSVRVLSFEIEPKAKLVDVRMAGGASGGGEGPPKAP